jgi:hypothetical protein
MKELVEVLTKSEVEEKTALFIKERFLPFFDQAEILRQKTKEIVVTDESQSDLMRQAREVRLSLRKIRIEADKVREDLKKDSLRYGKAVQGVYNVIEFLVVPLEEHLEKQEKFKEIKEQERVESFRLQRTVEIEHLKEYIPMSLNLGSLSQEEYDKLKNGAILQQEAKIKAEQDRIKAEEEAKIAEQKRIEDLRIEKERIEGELRKANEAIRIEKEKAEIERKKVEEQMEIERQKTKIAELAAKEEMRKNQIESDKKLMEEKRKVEEAKQATEKANLALKNQIENSAKKDFTSTFPEKTQTDREKVLELKKRIDNMYMPICVDTKYKDITVGVYTLLGKVASFIDKKLMEADNGVN